MKFEIRNRWTGAVRFGAEIEATDDTPLRARIGLAVRWAIANKADLTGADLRSAVLRSANLAGADLAGADLAGADLADADLAGADLAGADLAGAALRGADLTDADLTGADLTPIRDDLWAVLCSAPASVPALRAALNKGRVDGSTYSGDCACLVGTLANARRCEIEDMPGLQPDSLRPAERFFMAIKPGDTPATNQFSLIALGWVDEWLGRH